MRALGDGDLAALAVLHTAARLAADHGPFDLVLAGGLFDYLEERFARALIRTLFATVRRADEPG